MIGWKYRLSLVCIIDLNLSIFTTSFYCQKDCHFIIHVYAFVHEWYRVRLLIVYCVMFTKADAELEISIFLGDKYYRCGSLQLCGLDDILGDYLINLSLFEFARFWTTLVWNWVNWGSVWL